MSDIHDPDDVLNRILSFQDSNFSSFNLNEKKLLLQILQEIADSGESGTYEQIWLADYKEIPVSIDTFLDDNQFLGIANNQGSAIFPFWRNAMEEIFYSGNRYEEVFLTGATRTGKSSTGVTCTAYMLYKLMCLKNPQLYFEKKSISKFSVLFFNLTLQLAKGVAYSEFNTLLSSSPWFQEHGVFTKATQPEYIPEGNKIEVSYGSDASQALGKQVYCGFCVVGPTKILTCNGYKTIESLVDKHATLAQFDAQRHDIIYSNAEVRCTNYVTDTIRITLEDGTTIEGTPEHKIMLTNGQYKQLKDLTEDDDILLMDDIKIDPNVEYYCVYQHKCPDNSVYIGCTHDTAQRWGNNGIAYSNQPKFWNKIQQYGWANLQHDIIKANLSFQEAAQLEHDLITSIDNRQLLNDFKGFGAGMHYVSAASRQKMSKAQKDRKGKLIWITNNIIEKQLLAQDNIPKGFHKGRLPNMIYMHLGSHNIKIPSTEYGNFKNLGYMKGKSQDLLKKISKNKPHYYWIFDKCNYMFYTSEELSQYLNSHGYPTIVASTVVQIAHNNISSKSKYSALQGLIHMYKEYNYENIQN